jgi:segregation and condensation protein A
VASFLAVLELYREDRISLEQLTPLGDIYVTWNAAGDDDNDVAIDVDEDMDEGDPRDVDEDDAQT